MVTTINIVNQQLTHTEQAAAMCSQGHDKGF